MSAVSRRRVASPNGYRDMICRAIKHNFILKKKFYVMSFSFSSRRTKLRQTRSSVVGLKRRKRRSEDCVAYEPLRYSSSDQRPFTLITLCNNFVVMISIYGDEPGNYFTDEFKSTAVVLHINTG